MPCFKNAQEVNEIGLFDRAFHYGDGCFSTAKVVNGQIELLDRHLARLNKACEQLYLSADLQHIAKTLASLNRRSSSVNGSIKIVISRGEGPRGYSLPPQPADVWVFYTPQSVSATDYSQIESGLLQQRMGLSMPNLVGIKSLNRLEQVLLKKESDQHAWSEALVADIRGQIVEGVSSNCFIRINNQWMTPQLGYNGVHGVMRAEILARMQASNVACTQQEIGIADLAQIQSLFFCNALSPMKIVSQFDQRVLETQCCIDLFQQLHLNQIH